MAIRRVTTARLQRLATALSGALTVREVAGVIIAEGFAVLDANVGAVVLPSDDRATFRLLRAVGYPEGVERDWRTFPADTPLPVADAVRDRAPVVLETLEERNARYPLLARLNAPGGAAAALPLLIGDRAIGAIGLSFPTARRFDADDRGLMQALASLCAQALDRARLHDALRASEQRLRTVVQNAPVILFALDREGRFTLSEGRGLESLGQRPGQVVGASAFEVHRERPEIVRAIRAALRGGAMTSFSMLHGVAFETHWMPLIDGAGARSGAIGVAVDVTERTRAEEALRRANRALAAMSASHQVLARAATEPELLRGVCQAIVDVGGYPLAWVGYAEHDDAKMVRPVAHSGDGRYLDGVHISWADVPEGRGPGGMAIRTGQPCVVQNIRTAPSFAPWRAAALAQGYEATLSLPLICTGQAIGMLAMYAAEADAFDAEETHLLTQLAGDLAYGIAALRSRVAAAQAEEIHARLAAIVASSNDAITGSTLDGILTSWNPAAERLYGYTAQEMLGRSAAVLIPPDRQGELPAILDQIGRGERIDSYETVRVHREGRPVDVSLSISPVRDAGGTVIGVAVIARDIGARKQAEEARRRSAELEEQNRRIAEASRLKSDFLANMSHELRTPLNAIMGFAELLHDGKIGPVSPDQQEFLGDILTSSRHLLQIINDILDLAKVESGKAEFRPEPVDLAQIVAEVCAIVRTLAARKKLRITSAIDPAIGEVVLDPARLKQVLYNYLSNAIKFTDSGGTITISAEAAGAEHFRLAVRDTGRGISPQDQARLFTEFEQLHARAAPNEQGTGLGLALTRRIVEAQGGRVGVISAVGQGSLFYALLPRRADVDRALEIVLPGRERGTEQGGREAAPLGSYHPEQPA